MLLDTVPTHLLLFKKFNLYCIFSPPTHLLFEGRKKVLKVRDSLRLEDCLAGRKHLLCAGHLLGTATYPPHFEAAEVGCLLPLCGSGNRGQSSCKSNGPWKEGRLEP